jgi:hypothetical protein
MQLCEFQRHMTSWFKALEIAKANLAQTTSDQVIAVFRKWGDEELLLEFEIGSRPEYPDTLTKAYDLLLRVSTVKARRSSKPPPHVSSPNSTSSVLVAAIDLLKGKSTTTSSKTSKKKTRDAAASSAVASGGAPAEVSTGGLVCYGCGGPHKIRHCTDATVAKARSVMTKFRPPPGVKAASAEKSAVDDTSSRLIALLQTALGASSEELDIDANSVFLAQSPMVLAAALDDPQFNPTRDILLDNQAGVCIFNNAALLDGQVVRNTADMHLRGMDKQAPPLIVSSTGTWNGIPVGFSSQAAGNILSFALLKDCKQLLVESHDKADDDAGAW